MKNLLVLFCCALLMLTSSAGAQGPSAAASDSYRFGSRIVRIPAPAGFIDVLSRFEKMSNRFKALQTPGNELLAGHVPDTLIPRLEKGDDPDLDLYTRVSVQTQAKTVDITPRMYASFVTELESKFNTFLDPKGPILSSAIKYARKG